MVRTFDCAGLLAATSGLLADDVADRIASRIHCLNFADARHQGMRLRWIHENI